MAYDAALKQKLGDENVTFEEFRDNRRALVAPGRLFETLSCLKNDCGFDMLIDITAADYLLYPNARDRFGVMYCLLNVATGERVIVKTMLNEPELTLPSAYPLWRGADWMEREVFDMFGITFEGHPDLRRILLPEEFASHPLRKDYPVRGMEERHDFQVITRAQS